MPKLPRDLSGMELAKALEPLGYVITRQSGSHMRLSTRVPREHHLTIPAHDPLKIGTLNAILRELARARNEERDQVIALLFG